MSPTPYFRRIARNFLLLFLAVPLITACGKSRPDDETIRKVMTPIVQENVKYAGAALPQDAFRITGFDVLMVDVAEVGDAQRVRVEADVTIEITKSGSAISSALLQSGLAGALSTQSFTRGGGFLLKPGDTVAYRLQATLQERKGEYRFVDGSLDRR